MLHSSTRKETHAAFVSHGDLTFSSDRTVSRNRQEYHERHAERSEASRLFSQSRRRDSSAPPQNDNYV